MGRRQPAPLDLPSAAGDGQLAAGLKGQGFTQCFVCGSQLSLRGDEWRLRSKYEDGPQAGGSKYGKVDNGVIDIESDEVIDV